MARIVCPSGLEIDVRGFKAKEAGALADRTGMKSGASYTTILAACCEQVIDPGPYKLGEHGGLHWGQAIIADRFYALLQIRAATYGDLYEFNLQCAAPACREPIEWELRLKDLLIKPLPEASRAAIKEGRNRFETMIPSLGTRVWFKLQTGDGEATAAKILRGSSTDMMTQALAQRILEVEGVASHDRVAFLADMRMGDVMALLAAFDEHDGGVETEIEVDCPSCSTLMDVELPLGKEFFLPTPRKTKRPPTGSTRTVESSPSTIATGFVNASSPSPTSSTGEAA